jgi:lipopolysaccharide transport system ATP-binding protein
MNPMICVDRLSKLYRLGEGSSTPYRTLRESFTDGITGLWHRWRQRPTEPAVEEQQLWALRDVSFDVSRGEVVGIIGRNGAGKSTLLKLLSRITEPTAGRVEFHGRIGSLLEVGTGFHPELTGRENIYLNGSILGMTRREIDRRFDEIVAFAEVERFLDTPVKRYSSGMYVRLAFAVAAHLEPEVLLVDEVLAVGDFAFQSKCLGKMSEVSRSGRTILFVSHQMAAVESLCSRCLLFEQGRLVHEGDTRSTLLRYQAGFVDSSGGTRDLTETAGRTKGSTPVMREVSLTDARGQPVKSVRMGESLQVSVTFAHAKRPLRPVLGVVLKTSMGLSLFGINNRMVPEYRFDRPVTEGKITCRFDRLPVMPGLYALDLFFGDDQHDLDTVRDAISFEVTTADVFGSGKLPGAETGPFWWPASWSVHA